MDDEYSITPLDISLATSNEYTQSGHGVCELEDEFDDIEDAFALFCFFEDLHAIQEEIKSTWQHFEKEKVSLDVATIITRAAIDIVKRLEKEVLARRTREQSYNDPYMTLAMPVFYAASMIVGEDPREILGTPRALEHRPFHDSFTCPRRRRSSSLLKSCPRPRAWLCGLRP